MTPRPLKPPQGRKKQRREPLFHRWFQARPLAVRDALLRLRQRFQGQVCDDMLGRAELVLAEVMNNIAEHGGADPSRVPVIHLTVMRHDTGLVCAITDDGPALPGRITAQQPGLPAADTLPEGGFGWFLIHDLTQQLCYFRDGGRNVLAFTIPPQD